MHYRPSTSISFRPITWKVDAVASALGRMLYANGSGGRSEPAIKRTTSYERNWTLSKPSVIGR
jgi:hypothetical protein